MAYIGNDPSNRFVAPKAASVFSGDGSTTAFTLDHAVGSDEDILVSVDGVIQEPSVAYAVSNGTTLTFTAAPSSNSGNNIFVYYLFRTVGTVSHPSNNALTATNVTIADAGNIGSTSDTDAMAISSGGVVNFTQTPTLVTKTLTNTPSFKAYLGSNQSQTQNSITQVVYDTELYDSDNTYNTSNGRFTPAVEGKYFVNASIGFDGADANGRIRVYLYKNGSSYAFSSYGIGDDNDDGGIAQCCAIIELDSDDYVTAHVQYTGTDNVVGQQAKTWFEAFKLAGI